MVFERSMNNLLDLMQSAHCNGKLPLNNFQFQPNKCMWPRSNFQFSIRMWIYLIPLDVSTFEFRSEINNVYHFELRANEDERFVC